LAYRNIADKNPEVFAVGRLLSRMAEIPVEDPDLLRSPAERRRPVTIAPTRRSNTSLICWPQLDPTVTARSRPPDRNVNSCPHSLCRFQFAYH
jgi:hypothetical protein